MNNADSGAGSLRAALAAANNGDVIDFAPGVRTIGLTSSGLTIAADVTIRNDQGGPVTIDGGRQFTVFTVNKGVTAVLAGLTISDGFNGEGDGGGIDNLGALTVSDSTFVGNTADNDGGGIENFGTLAVNDSTFSGNSANFGAGGGVSDYGGTVTVSDSTFSGNFAAGGGGGVNKTAARWSCSATSWSATPTVTSWPTTSPASAWTRHPVTTSSAPI